MGKNKIDEILSRIDLDEKKGLLSHLVSSLIKGLNEGQKREMIEAVLSGRKEGKQLETMVER